MLGGPDHSTLQQFRISFLNAQRFINGKEQHEGEVAARMPSYRHSRHSNQGAQFDCERDIKTSTFYVAFLRASFST